MYPHVTQFETRDAELRDQLRLVAERRAGKLRRQGGTQIEMRSSRLRALAAALLRAG